MRAQVVRHAGQQVGLGFDDFGQLRRGRVQRFRQLVYLLNVVVLEVNGIVPRSQLLRLSGQIHHGLGDAVGDEIRQQQGKDDGQDGHGEQLVFQDQPHRIQRADGVDDIKIKAAVGVGLVQQLGAVDQEAAFRAAFAFDIGIDRLAGGLVFFDEAHGLQRVGIEQVQHVRALAGAGHVEDAHRYLVFIEADGHGLGKADVPPLLGQSFAHGFDTLGLLLVVQVFQSHILQQEQGDQDADGEDGEGLPDPVAQFYHGPLHCGTSNL